MKKKPSPAAQARAAFDPGPSPPSSEDSDAWLPRARRTIIEQARPPPGARLLSRNEVLKRVCVTYPCLWSWMQQGKFPRSRELANGRIAWIESEIEEWIQNLPVRKLKADAQR
jgi:predicted DNA-binding transcriptional regulator AlpA